LGKQRGGVKREEKGISQWGKTKKLGGGEGGGSGGWGEVGGGGGGGGGGGTQKGGVGGGGGEKGGGGDWGGGRGGGGVNRFVYGNYLANLFGFKRKMADRLKTVLESFEHERWTAAFRGPEGAEWGLPGLEGGGGHEGRECVLG